jgi:hypothetical protein
MTACQFSAALDLQQVPLREHGHSEIPCSPCQARTSLPTKLRTYLDEYLDVLEASGGLSERSYAAACILAVVCAQPEW